MRAALLAAALCLLMAPPAAAVRPDECEQQRAMFPKDWNDVSKEKPLFYCWSHYSGALRVTLGPADDKGRRLLSLVPLEERRANAKQDKSKDVFRIWLDKEQADRLQQGKYFATITRQRESCWIRGALSGADDGQEDSVFFMDNANPKSHRPDARSFFTQPHPFTGFHVHAHDCEAIK